ncbi:MAG: murein biosynthesis integral membrane protein MurJ [Acidimicrobiales bacterium]
MTDSPALEPTSTPAHRSGRAAALVAAGILLSRLTGVIREFGLRTWLGTTLPAADAFAAALIIPKLLQNLLGEGTLSASFIPVYSKLLEDENDDEAGILAGSVFSLLAVATAVLVLIGMLFAGPITDLVFHGFDDAKRELTVDLLRVMIGGIGFIVLSAWCLGVLNAHRRFFLSYVAPVLWNAAIIAAVAFAGIRAWAVDDVARAAAWGVLVGGIAQFLIQVPLVLRVLPTLRLGFNLHNDSVRTVLRRFVPAVSGRGVVTLSTFLDAALASLLVTGALASLGAAQVLYLMPISAFALSIAAAELPELSRGTQNDAATIRQLRIGLERIAFFLVFSMAIYLSAGESIVSLLFEHGKTTSDDARLIWLVLAAYSLGMPASGLSRLLQNVRFASGDVSGPARIAAFRVVVAGTVGVLMMFQLDRFGVAGGSIDQAGDLPAFGPVSKDVRTGTDLVRLGAVGLAIGASVAAWLELALLQRRVRADLPDAPRAGAFIVKLLPAGLVAGAFGLLSVWVTSGQNVAVTTALAGVTAGIAYLFLARSAGNQAAVELFAWRRSQPNTD